MNAPNKFLPFLALTVLAAAATSDLFAADAAPTLEIQADQTTARVSPIFNGLMTEEINFSYEGGIYGELIRNRSFKADVVNAGIKPDA
jgi:alpha-N-arabinofuranosidase